MKPERIPVYVDTLRHRRRRRAGCAGCRPWLAKDVAVTAVIPNRAASGASARREVICRSPTVSGSEDAVPGEKPMSRK
jgi:hypothetical protein